MAPPRLSAQKMRFGMPSMPFYASQRQYCCFWYSKVSSMFNLDDVPVNSAGSPKTALTLSSEPLLEGNATTTF
jgi:hypothetical protein